MQLLIGQEAGLMGNKRQAFIEQKLNAKNKNKKTQGA